jgi:hypothetical protein
MLRAGWAVAAFFGYMKGVANELAIRHVKEVVPHNDTLAGPWGRRGDQVGCYISYLSTLGGIWSCDRWRGAGTVCAYVMD